MSVLNVALVPIFFGCMKSRKVHFNLGWFNHVLYLLSNALYYFAILLLKNKTCSPCLHSLVKTKANVWENSRVDQWKREMQSGFFTSSRILTNFADESLWLSLDGTQIHCSLASSRRWYLFTDVGRMESGVSLGRKEGRTNIRIGMVWSRIKPGTL